MDSVECVYFEKKLTESDFIQNIEELDIPVRLSKNPKEQTSKSIYKKYYSDDSVVFSSIACLWKIRMDIHHALHSMRDVYKFILIGERGKEVIDNLIASWVLQKIHQGTQSRYARRNEPPVESTRLESSRALYRYPENGVCWNDVRCAPTFGSVYYCRRHDHFLLGG